MQTDDELVVSSVAQMAFCWVDGLVASMVCDAVEYLVYKLDVLSADSLV